jgi:hypothetical protein
MAAGNPYQSDQLDTTQRQGVPQAGDRLVLGICTMRHTLRLIQTRVRRSEPKIFSAKLGRH